MYKSKYFKTYELVPPEVYTARGEKAISLIDERVLITLDALRERFGPITINDWKWGGKFKQSGLRTVGHYGTYKKMEASYSQHKYGRAVDCKFKHVSAKAIREYVKSHKEVFPYITFIEDDVNWFHFDVRNGPSIVYWSPETNKSVIV